MLLKRYHYQEIALGHYFYILGRIHSAEGTAEAKLADHESRLTRIETIIEIAKPDGSTLRIAPPTEIPKGR
jgi:hypothetical protein